MHDSLPLWSAVASALHLLALGIGLGSVFVRGRALRGPLDATGIARVLAADNFFGVAALLWLSTGLWRALGPVGKTWAFYSANAAFHAKLTLFALVFLVELWPMTTFIRWRLALRRGATPDTRRARALGVVSYVEVGCVVVIVFLAALMARGVGQFR